jgi:hypothetical protein
MIESVLVLHTCRCSSTGTGHAANLLGERRRGQSGFDVPWRRPVSNDASCSIGCRRGFKKRWWLAAHTVGQGLQRRTQLRGNHRGRPVDCGLCVGWCDIVLGPLDEGLITTVCSDRRQADAVTALPFRSTIFVSIRFRGGLWSLVFPGFCTRSHAGRWRGLIWVWRLVIDVAANARGRLSPLQHLQHFHVRCRRVLWVAFIFLYVSHCRFGIVYCSFKSVSQAIAGGSRELHWR